MKGPATDNKLVVMTVYWLLVLVGISPATWLAGRLFSPAAQSASGANQLIINQPIYSLVFATLFLVAAGIAIMQRRTWMIIPPLSLLLLAVIPAWLSLDVVRARSADYSKVDQRTDELARLIGVLEKKIDSQHVVLQNCAYPDGGNWWNEWGEPLQDQCPTGAVMVGINGVQNASTKETMQRYLCCTISLEVR